MIEKIKKKTVFLNKENRKTQKINKNMQELSCSINVFSY